MERAGARFILAGHSHAYALGLPPRGHDALPEIVEIGPAIVGLAGGWPRDEQYWDLLVQISSGHVVVISWEGSQHVARFLLHQEPDFDFVLDGYPNREDVNHVVPLSLVRDYLDQQNFGLREILAHLGSASDCIKVVVGSPPPKNNDAILASFLADEEYFVQACERAGQNIHDLRFTPALVRIKAWAVVQALLAEAAAETDSLFVGVPNSVRDEGGFLLPRYWHQDITHGNLAYGDLMWTRIVEATSAKA